MSEKDGGAAFPSPYVDKSGNIEVLYKQQGMTLRDWFAGQAIPTLIEMQCAVNATGKRRISDEDVASDAYGHADSMLKERAKWPTNRS